jgi:hypothetical protein
MAEIRSSNRQEPAMAAKSGGQKQWAATLAAAHGLLKSASRLTAREGASD